MTTVFTLGADNLKQIANQLAAAGRDIGRVQTMAINRVAERTMTRAKREIVAQVNLKSSYVHDRMSLQKASVERPVAIIKARVRPTTLTTYGAKQVTRAAKRAKGDARRSIPTGRKQAGISVTVHPGRRRQMAGAFFVPLRAGSEPGGNGMGVFIRLGSGEKDIKHLHGPSVDQVFRGVVVQIIPDVQAQLTAELSRLAILELKKAIS